MEEIIARYNPWWESQAKFGYKKRGIAEELLKTADSNFITVITGLRRAGKTTLMRMIIEEMIKRGTDSGKILYLSLDNVGLMEKSLPELVEIFRKMKSLKFRDKIYLFFDEISYRKNYEIEAKNLFDMGNVKLFISSSSASILKSKTPYLTGRTKTFIVEPLDFKEFLDFRNISIGREDSHLYEKYFENYLEIGGMPEYVLNEDETMMSELIMQILYKDIIAPNDIREHKTVVELFRLLCERVGKPVTYNKLASVLRTTPDSIKKYISLFEEVYLFYSIEKCAPSLNERIYSPKKIYIGDIGLRNVTTGFKDKGSAYENLVFLKVKNHNPRYCLQNGAEIDFAFGDTLIEAKYGREMNEKQKELFNNLKYRKKLLADGHNFFLK